MQNEDDLPRDPPNEAYRPSESSLIVPANALRATLELLESAGRRESCVFWYGPRGVPNSKVAGVLSPPQIMTWGNYHVGPAGMSEMVALVPDEWRPLAQIHSHPGQMVEHSRYDDRMVSTKRVLSIVFPTYGRSGRPWPVGVGIHEYQRGYWYLLSAADAARRVQLSDDDDILARDLR